MVEKKIEIQILDAVHQNYNKLCPLDCETEKILKLFVFLKVFLIDEQIAQCLRLQGKIDH